MELKPIIWIGSSKDDLLEFPNIIKSELGYGLYYAQIGRQHVHSKPLKGFGGASVLEIIESDESGTFRLVYTIKMPKAIFVLHAFQKKSKHGIETPIKEIELVKKRLKEAQELYKEYIHGNKI